MPAIYIVRVLSLRVNYVNSLRAILFYDKKMTNDVALVLPLKTKKNTDIAHNLSDLDHSAQLSWCSLTQKKIIKSHKNSSLAQDSPAAPIKLAEPKDHSIYCLSGVTLRFFIGDDTFN